jgi:hypothetical protein
MQRPQDEEWGHREGARWGEGAAGHAWGTARCCRLITTAVVGRISGHALFQCGNDVHHDLT